MNAKWLQVEVDPSDKGALRLAREACPDVLLCEELKHLYTALTRAKNNVVVFDSNTAKRAPFFNYLRRLGMAQYVSRSAAFSVHIHSTNTWVMAKHQRLERSQHMHMHIHTWMYIYVCVCSECICVYIHMHTTHA